MDTEEEDQDAALRIMLNMKKSKVSNLCYQNLFDIIWSKIGENMEEDMRWTNMIQNQEREKNKEAVEYYIKTKVKRREHRQLTLSNSNRTMKWEIQLRHAQNNRKECLTCAGINQ